MHRPYFFVSLSALLLIYLPVSAAPPAERADDAVALVCRIIGEAAVRRIAADGAVDAPVTEVRWQPLQLYDRLAPGSRIRTGAESTVTVVFFDGQRFVAEASSRALIVTGGARAEAGSVRRLESVPAMVEIPRLARPGRHAAADRIRHEAVNGGQPFELYPRDSTLLADDAILRFTSVEGVGVYRIGVIDTGGREVFAAETEAKEIRIPEDKLAPGAVYYWRVSSPDRGLHGGAFFVTLSAETARARRRLAEQSAGGDPGLHLLSAEVDRGLGLRLEACDGLLATAIPVLGTGALEQALERFECGEWHQSLAREAGR